MLESCQVLAMSISETMDAFSMTYISRLALIRHAHAIYTAPAPAPAPALASAPSLAPAPAPDLVPAPSPTYMTSF